MDSEKSFCKQIKNKIEKKMFKKKYDKLSDLFVIKKGEKTIKRQKKAG